VEDHEAGELNESQVVLGMVLIAHYCSTPIEQPGEQAFDLPSATVPAKGPAILGGRLGPIAAMRADQTDAALSQGLAELVAVVGPVCDDPLGLDGTASHSALGQGHFIGSCAEGPYGERKTMSVCEDHDLGAFTLLSRSNITPPFLALAKVPSRKHSVMSIFPRSRRSSARRYRALSQTPALHQWLK